ncbi:homeobox protein CDX-1 [Phymastichus coffea]|uniref:homeobox protein CDX-1 n=1 Tax=Phymastichus coffea TaxID=108790 RepID=UPI00273C74A7|nr:homeobox protein CDX-1 [Phymastichus coffea]
MTDVSNMVYYNPGFCGRQPQNVSPGSPASLPSTSRHSPTHVMESTHTQQQCTSWYVPHQYQYPSPQHQQQQQQQQQQSPSQHSELAQHQQLPAQQQHHHHQHSAEAAGAPVQAFWQTAHYIQYRRHQQAVYHQQQMHLANMQQNHYMQVANNGHQQMQIATNNVYQHQQMHFSTNNNVQQQQQQQQHHHQMLVAAASNVAQQLPAVDWSNEDVCSNHAAASSGTHSPHASISDHSNAGTPPAVSAANNLSVASQNIVVDQMAAGPSVPHVRYQFGWMRRNSYQPNPGKTRTKEKYRVVYTEKQRIELEKEFYSSRYITIRRKSELAHVLKLSERQVKIWFQNRRAKDRKQNKKRVEMDQRNLDCVQGLQDGHNGMVPGPSTPTVPPIGGMSNLSINNMNSLMNNLMPAAPSSAEFMAHHLHHPFISAAVAAVPHHPHINL